MTLVWRPGYGGAAVSDPDAMAYLRAVEEADNQALEQGVQQAVNQFVIGCKADGIWDAIKASCILAGARTLAGALVPLVGNAPTRQGTEGGWNYNRKTGLAGNGSNNYIDSGASAVTVTPQNNAHLSTYVTVKTSGSQVFIGALSTLSPVNTCQIGQATVGAFTGFINGSAGSADVSYVAPNFLGGSRSNSASYVTRVNQSNATTVNTSTSPGALNHYIFARNSAGTAASFSNARLSFYSIGESLNLAALDARVTNLMTAIGAAIP